MDISYDDLEPWIPPSNLYPTIDDVLRFYCSRMIHGNRNLSSEVKGELSKFVYDVWEKGDGCPKTVKKIIAPFEKQVLPLYKKYHKGDGKGAGSHKKKRPVEFIEPTRKSRRTLVGNSPSPPIPSSACSSSSSASIDNETIAQSMVIQKRTSSRGCRKQWMEDHGKKLFNVFSEDRLKKMQKDHKE